MLLRRYTAWAALVCASLFLAPSSERLGGAAVDARARPHPLDGSEATAKRPWPVDVPVHLSSSFGEFRDGHLHAGVDVRSFGLEGIPCRSVGRGHVSRLRASPDGYGKAVYIKLDSGETAVYAHLSEFAPAIDSVVHAAQVESGRYRVDVYPPPGALSVAAGEVIAYTGRTGAASPHLHFEVRDAEERPVNPLDAGWSLGDGTPPGIRRLQCLPLAPDARVNGRFAAVVVELRSDGGREFTTPETLRVSGAVGFGAQIIDRLGESSGNLAPYRVELEIDGERVSAVELKRFAYAQTAEVELVYDIARARSRGQHFMLLFRKRGETLGDREFVNDGVVRIATAGADGENGGGIHRAVVRAADRAGNVSTATWIFVASPHGAPASKPFAGAASRGAVSHVEGELPGFYFYEDMMGARGAVLRNGEGAKPGAATAGAGRRDARGETETDTVISVDAIRESELKVPVRFAEGTREAHVIAVRKDQVLRRDFDDVGVGLTVGSGSLYANALLYVVAWERDGRATLHAGTGMRVVSPAVRLGPVSAAFKAPLEIRFATDRAVSSKAAVFRFDERRGSWSLRSSAVVGDTVRASVREPGVYAVLADSLAPSIAPPYLASRRSFATGLDVRELIVPIVDNGCGVDADGTEVYLDGKKQIARWDGFLEKVFVILRDKNIIGVHELSIVAVDRLGNSTRLVTQLQVPPPAKQGATGGPR